VNPFFELFLGLCLGLLIISGAVLVSTSGSIQAIIGALMLSISCIVLGNGVGEPWKDKNVR